MGTFKEVMTASECVYANMKEFSAYTIKSKFPNTIDGLKPIHRRILLALHENPKKAKEATVAGRVMERHPHGDASISDAIASLTQPFNNIAPLVFSRGNVGTYHGERPAAARYLDVYEAEFANDLFFKNTEPSCLQYVAPESGEGIEPANFVPVIPNTLVFPVIGIGFGYKTETSAISLANCCILARKFVEMKYKDPMGYRKKISSLCQYLIPDFPTYCTIRNAAQVVAEYKKGNYEFPFVIDGVMDITKNSITISTLPPDTSYPNVTEDAGKETMVDKDSWLHEHFMPSSDLADKNSGISKGCYVFPLRRGENPFEVLTMFKKRLQFTSIWHPYRLYCDDQNGMTSETPFSLLEKWSDARYKVVLGGLKQKLIDLQKRYRYATARLVAIEHPKEFCDLFIKSKDAEATVQYLVKHYNLSPFQSRYLQSLQIKQLTAKGRQELLDEIEEIKQKNKELQSRFTKIADEIIANIESFEKKYAQAYPSKCKVPKYIGTACYKGTGWIMLESLKECDEILTKFEPENIKFNLFQGDGPIEVIGTDEILKDYEAVVPKYIYASYVGQLDSKSKHLAIRLKNDGAFVPKPNMIGLLPNDPVPVGDRCSVIFKTEGRKIVEVNAKNSRASINVQSGTLKDVLYISPVADEDVVVIHGNPRVSGVVNIDRIVGNGKISRTVVGETKVIGVFKVNEPILFSIPQDVSSRTAVKHMYIKDISKFVQPGETLKLLLTKKRTSTEKEMAPYMSRSAIYTIKE